MFCGNCGTQIPDDTQFCPNCGQKIEAQEEAPKAETKEEAKTEAKAEVKAEAKQPKKESGAKPKVPVKLIAILVAVVAVICVCVTAFGGKGGSGVKHINKKAVFIQNSVAFNLEGKTNDLDDHINNLYYSADQGVTLYKNNKDELYIVGNKDLKADLVAESVDRVFVGVDGKYVVYTVFDKNKDNAYNNEELFIYDVKKSKSERIDDEVSNNHMAVSPNCKYVAYLKDYESSSDNKAYMGGIGKKAKEIGEKDGKYPVAVSNNGKKIFIISNENKLYVSNGKDSTKIENSDVVDKFAVNAEGNQLMYIKDGKTYIYKGGKDSVKICSYAVEDILEPGVSNVTRVGNNTRVYNAASFNGCIFTADDSYYWIDKKGKEAIKICSEYENPVFSEDLQSAIISRGSRIFKISNYANKKEDEIFEGEDEILGLVASKDLKKIYVEYKGNVLAYVKNKSKVAEITDEHKREKGDSYEITNDAYSCYDSKAGKIYFIADDELYVATTSKKSAKKVNTDDDVIQVRSIDGIVMFRTKKDDLYMMKGGKPVLIYEHPSAKTTESND